MQGVRDRYPDLFSPDKNTMQLFMWQRDIVGAPGWLTTSWIVLRCSSLHAPTGALGGGPVMHQPHIHQPWRLDRCNLLIHSFIHSLRVQ